MYGAHRVGKLGAQRSQERPIVCSMCDETKHRIILDNSWIYLKGTGFYVCEDLTLIQQEAYRKAYESRANKKLNKKPHNEKMTQEETTPAFQQIWIYDL